MYIASTCILYTKSAIEVPSSNRPSYLQPVPLHPTYILYSSDSNRVPLEIKLAAVGDNPLPSAPLSGVSVAPVPCYKRLRLPSKRSTFNVQLSELAPLPRHSSDRIMSQSQEPGESVVAHDTRPTVRNTPEISTAPPTPNAESGPPNLPWTLPPRLLEVCTTRQCA